MDINIDVSKEQRYKVSWSYGWGWPGRKRYFSNEEDAWKFFDKKIEDSKRYYIVYVAISDDDYGTMSECDIEEDGYDESK